MADQDKHEFSRMVKLEALKDQKKILNIAASEQECMALAKRFGLVRLANFSSSVSVTPLRRDGNREYLVEGELAADVVQSCVVTTEPVETHVASPYCVRYMSLDAFKVFESETETALLLSDEEDVEPLDDKDLDIGELVAQQLALSLNPYPRISGARIDDLGINADVDRGMEAGEGKKNPFALLKKLYDKG